LSKKKKEKKDRSRQISGLSADAALLYLYYSVVRLSNGAGDEKESRGVLVREMKMTCFGERTRAFLSPRLIKIAHAALAF
jgi:hypothetical protein